MSDYRACPHCGAILEKESDCWRCVGPDGGTDVPQQPEGREDEDDGGYPAWYDEDHNWRYVG